jgi:phosphate transport system substrate-binding protein
MQRKLVAVAAALATALAAAASAFAGGAASAGDPISGAGSSFVFPLVSQWMADYGSKTGTQVTYNPVGSGAGIAAITARTVDFGASDAPLTPDQFSACNGCVQIPWALSSTAIVYNVPNVPNNLKLTGPVIADIYLGKIKKWNDPQITKLNPKVTLPDTDITPVFRSDGSGTTYNFTDYLSAISPEWKSKVGNSTQVNFPAGVGGRGSSGLAGVVNNTTGAIGYVDIAYALANRIKFASVQNNSGKFVTPGLKAIAAAGLNVKTVPANNELHIVNPPKGDPLAYPICTFTYVILPTKSAKSAELRKFVFYAVNPSQGQKFGPRLLFAPLPKTVLVAAEKTLKQIGT